MKLKGRNITIAVCQHDVCLEVNANLVEIKKQIKSAKSGGADIVHFSECNLTGYAGIDFQSVSKVGFDAVLDAMADIQKMARELKMCVVFGSHYFEDDDEMPKNGLFYVNQEGTIEARYYKRILAGAPREMDHKFYSAGDRAVVFHINGIRCGMLICHEWRYPEFYREYKKLGVEIVFHSWYDGGLDDREYIADGEHAGELIMGYVKGNAANNYLWVSGSNTSKKESCFPSFIVRPDGRIAAKSERNQARVLIHRLDLDQEFEDPSKFGREQFL